jgi:hypothetical protein
MPEPKVMSGPPRRPTSMPAQKPCMKGE